MDVILGRKLPRKQELCADIDNSVRPLLNDSGGVHSLAILLDTGKNGLTGPPGGSQGVRSARLEKIYSGAASQGGIEVFNGFLLAGFVPKNPVAGAEH